MPELNHRQFVQPELGFLDYTRTGPSRSPAPHDPGPNTKRGSVGQGQQIMNFDAPDYPLETAEGGLVPVSETQDPAWDSSAWRYGGASRGVAEAFPNSDREHHVEARRVTAAWRSAPVETIGPDAEVRTNQGEPQIPAVGNHPGFRAKVADLDDDKVDELRDAGDLAYLDPSTSAEEYPWVAEVEGKRYLMEGHHRFVAGRSRDSGDVPARVIRGGNWGQIDEQMYDGPRSR